MNHCKDCHKEIKETSTRCKTCNNIFQHKHKKVLEKTSKSNKEYYKKIKNKSFNSYLTLSEMKKQVSEIDLTKLDKFSGHRTFLKQHPVLFYSINEYIDNLDINFIRPAFLSKIELIKRGIDNAKCLCGKTIIWDYTKKDFRKGCSCCYKITSGPNALNKRMLLYGNKKGKELYDNFCKSCKDDRKGLSSLKWFNEKYGDKGQEKYDEFWQYNFSKRKGLSYSKISQDLFFKLKDSCEFDTNEIRFAENSKKGELRVNFNKADKELIGKKRVCMFLDFVYKDKVIEFDGTYWHQDSKDIDSIKETILNSKGYTLLRVKEEDYKTNPEKEINKCIQFLKS